MQTFSPEEVADQLGVHPSYVKKKVWSKEWACERFGRTVRFTPKQVDRILAIHEQESARPSPGPTRQQLVSIGVSPTSAARQRRRPAAATAARKSSS